MINSLIKHFQIAAYSMVENLTALKFLRKETLSSCIQKTVCDKPYGYMNETPIQYVKIPQFATLSSNFTSYRSIHTLSIGNQTLLKNGFESSPLQKHSLEGSFSVRGRMRHYFPRPSEIKRIKKHGWKKRMSTKAGREIIMARILKGRHCITH